MSNCRGRDKCLKCNVKPEDCVTVNRAQEVSFRSVLAGELKAPEALELMARRFPGKAGRGPYDDKGGKGR